MSINTSKAKAIEFNTFELVDPFQETMIVFFVILRKNDIKVLAHCIFETTYRNLELHNQQKFGLQF